MEPPPPSWSLKCLNMLKKKVFNWDKSGGHNFSKLRPNTIFLNLDLQALHNNTIFLNLMSNVWYSIFYLSYVSQIFILVTLRWASMIYELLIKKCFIGTYVSKQGCRSQYNYIQKYWFDLWYAIKKKD